jgi:uncharacterized protein
MTLVSVRLYAELNDRLSPEAQMKPFPVTVPPPGSIRELFSAIPVPEEKVELVLVNGQSVDLDHKVQDGDSVSVYPIFESFDVASLVRLRDHPLRESRFVLDTHLGKLATFLRMLGFDALYRSDYHDDELLAISTNEGRILLSRDRELVSSGQLTRAYRVCETDPHAQVREVVDRIDLRGSLRPFIRCMRCNTLLQPVEKEAILERLPPRIQELYNEFQLCPTCDRVYWKGSHYGRMSEFIQILLRDDRTQGDRPDPKSV